jgi:hypothetical protein
MSDLRTFVNLMIIILIQEQFQFIRNIRTLSTYLKIFQLRLSLKINHFSFPILLFLSFILLNLSLFLIFSVPSFYQLFIGDYIAPSRFILLMF